MVVKTKKLAPLPTSKAKTAYGLLSEVRKLILAEPKRYNQNGWIWRVGGVAGAYFIEPEEAPRCGTVGCVAGWVATLKFSQQFTAAQTEYIAMDVLGLSSDVAFELFSSDSLNIAPGVNPGTLPYAKAGAKHIARFQKKYAKQLKAKAV